MQLESGEVFVSSNDGIALFDGKQFKKYPHEGRGKAISSATFDERGRLWCNSFHGDIFFLENGVLRRHPISKTIKEITSFYRLGKRLFLATESTLYEVEAETKEINEVQSFKLIKTLFESKGRAAVLHGTSFNSGKIYSLHNGQQSEIQIPETYTGRCKFMKGSKGDFLFFQDSKRLMRLNDFMKGAHHDYVEVPYPGKINQVTFIGEHFIVAGMNGVHFYNTNGDLERAILRDYRVTYFSQDLEGNYLATTMGNGFILIPDLNVTVFNYEDYLDNEHIISSIQVEPNALILGTNAGTILYHDLKGQTVQTMRLGQRSEVQAFTVDAYRKVLYAYCDALYRIDMLKFKVIYERRLTSVKNMLFHDDELFLGSRNGLYVRTGKELKYYGEPGWNLSVAFNTRRNELLFSTKKGVYIYDVASQNIEKLKLGTLKTDRNVLNIDVQNRGFTFLYDFHKLLHIDNNYSAPKVLYTQQNKNLTGSKVIGDAVYLFLKDSVFVLNDGGEVQHRISALQGLNEPRTKNAFVLGSALAFVHRSSLTIFNSLPTPKKTPPSLKYSFSGKGTFRYEDGVLESDWENNNLILDLTILKSISSRGNAQVFYRIVGKSKKWKSIENPYSSVQFERLPIGNGTIELKVLNEYGITSEVIKIPFQVNPPFYLTWWFILVVGVVLILSVVFIVRWRVTITRKKALERLRQKQLESRALNAELTAIRSQMNPHFIFNVLTAIQAKVIEGKSDEAYQNIGDFAVLIRNVLEKSGKEFIYLNDEIELMKNYVELENSRLFSPIELCIEVEDPDYFDEVLIPTLITQPIIENAIKHAFPKEKENKRIELLANRYANGFSLTIRDNGVGMSATKNSNKDHDSFALDAMRKRIKVLSEKTAYTIRLHFESSAAGTEVKFLFTYD
jgi:hypothetical protein